MDKNGFDIDNPQRVMCHETKPNKTKFTFEKTEKFFYRALSNLTHTISEAILVLEKVEVKFTRIGWEVLRRT